MKIAAKVLILKMTSLKITASNSDNDADAGNPNAAMAHQPVAAVEDENERA